MSINRQVNTCKIGAVFYNGSFRFFENYPIDLNIYNLDARAREQFRGSATTEALDGFGYSNLRGYRLEVSIDLTESLQRGTIRTLFNTLSGDFNRTVWTATAATDGVSTTALNIAGTASSETNYYTGLLVDNISGATDRTALSFNVATNIVTLNTAGSWSVGDPATFVAQSNYKTLIGLSLDSSANYDYYNVVGVSYGVNRDLTINQQRISLELEGVELVQTIPDNFRIA